MESPKTCAIYSNPCLSNSSTIFQKGTYGINEVSRPKNDNFTLRAGMHVHVSCKKNHIRTPRVPSSRAEVSYRKPRTSSGGFNRKGCFYCGCAITEREKKTKKSCNVSYKNQEVGKAANKLSLTENMMSGPMTLKALCLCEDAVYHIHCSSGFQTGKDNPKKSILSRKCGRDTTIGKERAFLKIVEHIDSHSDEQFDITILGRMIEEKLSGNNVLCLI